MISKSERLLIFRFLFSKKSDGYVSIFAWFSIIGISLGVAAIIIVMSVMNGFRIDLTNRIIGLNSHLNIYSFDNEITNKQADELILNIDNSFFYQHYKSIETNGLIIKSNNSKGVMIKGYDAYDKNHYLFNSINLGTLIQNPKNEILIGKTGLKYEPIPRFELGTFSLPRKRSTPELHRLLLSGRPGSNRRHSAWMADALPAELLPLDRVLWGEQDSNLRR